MYFLSCLQRDLLEHCCRRWNAWLGPLGLHVADVLSLGSVLHAQFQYKGHLLPLPNALIFTNEDTAVWVLWSYFFYTGFPVKVVCSSKFYGSDCDDFSVPLVPLVFIMQVEWQIGPSVCHCNGCLYFVQLFYVPFSALVPVFAFFLMCV